MAFTSNTCRLYLTLSLNLLLERILFLRQSKVKPPSINKFEKFRNPGKTTYDKPGLFSYLFKLATSVLLIVCLCIFCGLNAQHKCNRNIVQLEVDFLHTNRDPISTIIVIRKICRTRINSIIYLHAHNQR